MSFSQSATCFYSLGCSAASAQIFSPIVFFANSSIAVFHLKDCLDSSISFSRSKAALSLGYALITSVISPILTALGVIFTFIGAFKSFYSPDLGQPQALKGVKIILFSITLATLSIIYASLAALAILAPITANPLFRLTQKIVFLLARLEQRLFISSTPLISYLKAPSQKHYLEVFGDTLHADKALLLRANLSHLDPQKFYSFCSPNCLDFAQSYYLQSRKHYHLQATLYEKLAISYLPLSASDMKLVKKDLNLIFNKDSPKIFENLHQKASELSGDIYQLFPAIIILITAFQMKAQYASQLTLSFQKAYQKKTPFLPDHHSDSLASDSLAIELPIIFRTFKAFLIEEQKEMIDLQAEIQQSSRPLSTFHKHHSLELDQVDQDLSLLKKALHQPFLRNFIYEKLFHFIKMKLDLDYEELTIEVSKKNLNEVLIRLLGCLSHHRGVKIVTIFKFFRDHFEKDESVV